MSDANDFWIDYEGFGWQTVSEVSTFLQDAVDNETYIDGFQQFDYGSDWIENWWFPVQESILSMIHNFPPDDLQKAIEILLEPMESFPGDCAIMDSLISGGVDFTQESLKPYLENYYVNWCEDSYVSWPWEDIQFSYCAYESIALSPATSAEMLTRLFRDSFSMSESHIVFRIRVALAKNPSTPAHILKYLFDNRNGTDWLISDPEGYSPLTDNFEIDEDFEGLDDIRSHVQEMLNEGLSEETTYMFSILGIDWVHNSALEALLCAFASNIALTDDMYMNLYESGFESTIYYLSKNKAVAGDLKSILESTKPTFTLTYAGAGFEDTLK